MNYLEAHRHFLAALRRDPATPAPALRKETTARFHEWKDAMRAYDQARIDVGLATPRQVQAENTATGDGGRPRMVRHARYA